MKITLQITFLDGSVRDVLVSAADMVAFEDKFNLSIARLEEARIGWLLFLAWHSEQRRKQTDKTYDEWIEQVETIGANNDPKEIPSKA
jgi:hypothetical protein